MSQLLVPNSKQPIAMKDGFVSRPWHSFFAWLSTRFIGDPVGAQIMWGTGSPAAVIVADTGSLWINLNGGAGTTLYVKESGNGTSAGWRAV